MTKINRRNVLKSAASSGIAARMSVIPANAARSQDSHDQQHTSELAVFNNSSNHEDVTMTVRRDPSSNSLFERTDSVKGLNSPSNPSKEDCRSTSRVTAQADYVEYQVTASLGDGRTDQTEVLLTPQGLMDHASISVYVHRTGELTVGTSIS